MDLGEETGSPNPTAGNLVAAPAVLAVLVGGLGALAVATVGPPLLLLGLALVAGMGITYLGGIALTVEERVLFGAVIGAMAVSLFGFIAAYIAGFGATSVVVGAVAAGLVSLPGWLRAGSGLRGELGDLRERWLQPPLTPGHPWPLLAVMVVCGLYTLRLMSQAYAFGPDGLRAGQLGVWGDWAAHLAYAGSFAYGQNFPPEFPVDPGHRLGYPFMIDFLAASLVPLGAGLTSSLAITSGFLGLAFPGVFYLAGLRFLGSRAAAAAALFVFVLGGGLGFSHILADVGGPGSAGPATLAALLTHLPHEYTHIPADNYQWLNPVLANLLPQRSTLFGFSLALIALALLFTASRSTGTGSAPYLAAGVLIGVTPAFHVHAYGTVVALSAFWALLAPRREWVAFFVPALLLGLPAVVWMFPPARDACADGHGWCLFGLRLQIGWLASTGPHPDPVPWFWLKNLGLFIPALVVAQLWRGLIGTGFALFAAPIWLWFVVPNLVLLHPWDWDNNKFFIFWFMLGSMLVGALVARLFKAGAAGVAAGSLLCLVLGLSGALDLARAVDYPVSSIPFTDRSGLDTADWVRTHTAPRAVFLVSTQHNEPVPSLAGRRVVIGYTGWIWSYGISDWAEREIAVKRMLQGDPATPQLLARYSVDYVVIGPQERAAPFSAAEDYWRRSARLVYSNGGYEVFRTNRKD